VRGRETDALQRDYLHGAGGGPDLLQRQDTRSDDARLHPAGGGASRESGRAAPLRAPREGDDFAGGRRRAVNQHDLNDLRRDYGPNGRPMRVPPAVKLALEEMGQEIEERRPVLRQEAAAYDEIA